MRRLDEASDNFLAALKACNLLGISQLMQIAILDNHTAELQAIRDELERRGKLENGSAQQV